MSGSSVDRQKMLAANQAINDLLAFVDEFEQVRELRGSFTSWTLTNEEVKQFHELDQSFYVCLGAVGMLDQLPSAEVLSRSLDLDQLPRVQFEGKSNLPGDREDGLFSLVEDDWRNHMTALQALLVRLLESETVIPSARGTRGVDDAKNSKQKRGRKSDPEGDRKIADEYSQGLSDGRWEGHSDYLRKKHNNRWQKSKNNAKSWLSSLLKRVSRREIKTAGEDEMS
jgi:hypothetical protein